MPYNRILRLAVAATAVAVLGGCNRGDLQRSFGLTREPPDEFVVSTRAPLSMPPDFTVRPPRPGAERPQETALSTQAEAALVPGAVLPDAPKGEMSAGQEALLAAAGPAAPPNVREQVNAQAAKEASNKSLTDEILFWRSPHPPGLLVDAPAEADRLKNAAALGESPDTGKTPIVQPKSKNFLDTLF
jgi:hypothetical protein